MNLKKSRFYDYSVQEIENLSGARKRLLLHACCGPCSCFPLLFLCPHFDVTIYYVNPNIYPEQEYKRRLEELTKLLGYVKRDYGYDVSLVIPPYEPEPYQEHMKSYEGMKEGSARCLECYRYRMERAYQYAEDNARGQLVLRAIVETEHLDLTDAEYESSLTELAEESGMAAETLKSSYPKSMLMDILRQEKVEEFLQNNMVTD